MIEIERLLGYLRNASYREFCGISGRSAIRKGKEMKKVALGNTGLEVSQVCLGNMLMGSTIGKEDSFRILDRFVEAGGNFIDTANCYAWWIGKGEFVGDEGEMILGEWMKSRGLREKLVVSTKVGARLKNPSIMRNEQGEVYWDRISNQYEFLAPETIRKGVEDSLRRLQTDYIDLYFAHIDDRRTPLEETLRAFDDLVRAGKVRHIGCSNFRTWRLAQARQLSEDLGLAKYSVLQQNFSYLRPRANAELGIDGYVDDGLVDYQKSNPDLAVMVCSPLLKGLFNDSARRAAYYNWHLYDTADSAARLAVLEKMAAELGVTGNQLVLAWMLHLEAPKTIPLLGFSRMSQLEENLKALDISLSPEQMATLSKAGA